MPITQVCSSPGGFEWIDLKDPTREELENIAERYGLHRTSVKDCLEPEHLPKHETIRGYFFVIARYFDAGCSDEADTVQELTNKLALFSSTRFLITIHRHDPPWLAELRQKWSDAKTTVMDHQATQILSELLQVVFRTYEEPVEDALEQLDGFEASVFSAPRARAFELHQGYYLKRRALVFKRLFKLSLDVVDRIGQDTQINPSNAPYFRDLRDSLDDLHFYSEEILEGLNSLLNLHLSISSHRTNEVMRVLTVFSVFFLPLNFIAGIYGMNFEYMPELKWRLGYAWALGAMITVALTLFVWFRRKGWLK